MTRQEIERAAMQLPDAERELLFLRLAQAMDASTVVEVTGQDKAVWDERFAQWQSGKVQGVPGDQVTETLRRDLGWT